MNFFKKIFNLFRPAEKIFPDRKVADEELPQNQETCPMCWGFQEYDHKIRTKYKDKQIDVKNHKNMFLKSKRFVVTNIDGIRYKKAVVVSECPKCGKEIVTDEDLNSGE